MTSREKTVLRRWIFSVLIITRLLFFLPATWPELFAEHFPNQTWLDMTLSVNGQQLPLTITHQFLDPLVLALLVYVIGRLWFWSTKLGRAAIILLILPILLWLSYSIFYQAQASHLAYGLVKSIQRIGPIFGWVCLTWSAMVIVFFLFQGVVAFFEKDHPKNSD